MSETSPQRGSMELLISAVQELSMARNLESVMAIVRRVARALTDADGATFVLRDGELCHYAELEQRVVDRTAQLEKANRKLKESQAHLVHSAKMASLGQLVAGIAHSVVQAHQGRIEVHSEEGRGTEIVIEIPLDLEARTGEPAAGN